MMPCTASAPLMVPVVSSAMGPFTMDDDGDSGEPHALIGSSVGFATASSMFASGFYGGGGNYTSCACATPSPQPHPTAVTGRAGLRAASHDDSASYTSATRIYGYAGSSGAHGFSHSSLYGTPSTMQDVAYGYSSNATGGGGGGAAMFTVPQFGAANRSGSDMTAGTALSDCHLSRKDDGGFSPESARTFVRSQGSFIGPISEDSRPSLHDSALGQDTSKSGLLRDSAGSLFYPDGAAHFTESQRRLSSSGAWTARNAAVRLSTDASFSATFRSGNAKRQASPRPAAHANGSTQPPRQRPHLTTSHNGAAHHSSTTVPPTRPSPNADAHLSAAATTARAEGSREGDIGGFGPMGCSPLYDLDAVLGEMNLGSKTASSVQSPATDLLSSNTLAPANEPRRTASNRRGHRTRELATRSITSSLASGPNSAAVSACSSGRGTRPAASRLTSPDQSSVLPTEKKKVGPVKPRRKNPRRVAAAPQTTKTTTATSAAARALPGVKSPKEDSLAAATKATANAAQPVMLSSSEEQPRKLSSSISSASVGPIRPGSRSRKTSASCTVVPPSAVRHPPPPPLGAVSLSGISSEDGTLALAMAESSAPCCKTPTAFTVAPPAQRERQATAFQRRRYLEGACAPLSVSDVQLLQVPPSPPHRGGAGASTGCTSESPNALAKFASSLPRSELLLLSSATTQPRSPQAAASSTCSSSVGADRLSALGSGTGGRRSQLRCGAPSGGNLAGFHPALHMEGLSAAAENPDEKSVRSLGGRSIAELHGLQESCNNIMSRSCPSMECSADDMGNPFLARRSSSWSVHSARSATESGENPTVTVRRRRLTERAMPTATDLEEEQIMMQVLAIR